VGHQATYTNRPAVHPLLGLGSVEFSHEPRLAGELTVTISHLSSEQLITTIQLQILGYEAQ
jgi:hypothetical protein